MEVVTGRREGGEMRMVQLFYLFVGSLILLSLSEAEKAFRLRPGCIVVYQVRCSRRVSLGSLTFSPLS